LVSEFSFHLLHLFDQIFKYYAVVEQEGGSLSVSFPDLENCFTDGETVSQAVVMAEDVNGKMLSL